METKLSKLRAAHSSGDKISALRIAARFPRLGNKKDAITRGWSAHQNPEFYRQIGQMPEDLIASGIKAMEERYGL